MQVCVVQLAGDKALKMPTVWVRVPPQTLMIWYFLAMLVTALAAFLAYRTFKFNQACELTLTVVTCILLFVAIFFAVALWNAPTDKTECNSHELSYSFWSGCVD